MNYLAHAYLSFNHPDILVGNMISDFVKGKKQYDFSLSIQKGILLHRAIDHFTDHHPATKAAKEWLKPAAGAYAGAFIDIVYDHFLALDTTEMAENDWKTFAGNVYQQLSIAERHLPEKFAGMLPYMSKQDWLYNYRHNWGVAYSFEGLVRRAAYLNDSSAVFSLFTEHYQELQHQYALFFPEVKLFAQSHLDTLIQ